MLAVVRSLFFAILFCAPGLGRAQVDFNANDGVSYESLKRIIEKQGLMTIDAILPLLPKQFRSGYTLVHESRSSQEASAINPRVIMFGQTARTILSFNGDPSQLGYNILEMIEFNPVTDRFDFYEIQFSAKDMPLALPKFAKNPPACMGCHRDHNRDLKDKPRDARPNWDQYPKWDGLYGANEDFLDDHEKELFREYKRHVQANSSSRYRHLIDTEHGEFTPFTEQGKSIHAKDRPNSRLSILLSQQSARRTARLLREGPNYELIRDVLLLMQTISSYETMPPEVVRALTSRGFTNLDSKMHYDEFQRSFFEQLTPKNSDWSLQFSASQFKKTGAIGDYWNGIHRQRELVLGLMVEELVKEDSRFKDLYTRDGYFKLPGYAELGLSENSIFDRLSKYELGYENAARARAIFMERIQLRHISAPGATGRPRGGACEAVF